MAAWEALVQLQPPRWGGAQRNAMAASARRHLAVLSLLLCWGAAVKSRGQAGLPRRRARPLLVPHRAGHPCRRRGAELLLQP